MTAVMFIYIFVKFALVYSCVWPVFQVGKLLESTQRSTTWLLVMMPQNTTLFLSQTVALEVSTMFSKCHSTFRYL